MFMNFRLWLLKYLPYMQYNIAWIMLLNTIDAKIHTIHCLSEYMPHVYFLVMEVISRGGTLTQEQLIELLITG